MISPHVCEYCQHSRIIRGSAAVYRYWRGEVEDGAEDGCSFFRWMIRSALYDEDIERWELHLVGEKWDIHRATVYWMNKFGVKGICEEFAVMATEDDLASRDIRGRPVVMPGDFVSLMRYARQNLEQCHTAHEICKEPLSTFVQRRIGKTFKRNGVLLPTSTVQHTPSILIQIDPGLHKPSLRLKCTTNGMRETYVALSYCWGTEDTPTTRLSVLESWRNDLPFSLLPQTIRDAVLVTQGLGIRYLWVDAFCIVQDDKEMKTREIPKMAQVYGNADVTILASKADKSAAGFLQDSRLDSASELAFYLPYRGRDSESEGTEKTGFIMLSSKFPSKAGSGEQQLEDEPINARGWTLQERLLSPRILEFGTFRLRWKCRQCLTVNGGSLSDTFARRAEYLDIKPYQNFQDFWERPRWKNDNKDICALFESWYRIVEEFSSRTLGKEEDKLPAIAGIAQEYAEILSDSYIAGLWKSRLPWGLLWSRKSETKALRRPSQYRAPSWSWASVDGEINYRPPKGHGFGWIVWELEVLSCAERRECFELPYESVTPTILRSRGRVKEALWQKRTHRLGNLDHSQYECKIDAFFDAEAEGKNTATGVDTDEYESEEDDDGCESEQDTYEYDSKEEIVFCLEVICDCHVLDKELTTTYGVILRQVDGSAFTRLGVFAACGSERKGKEKEDWFQGCMARTLTII